MDPFDPILDKPYAVEFDKVEADALYPLANQDVLFAADAQANLHRLFWPWADAAYARRIIVRIFDLHDDEFVPMITQSYPGYQETIYGTEGMIVSKRLVAPFKSPYDRAAMWLLDCEAEGDRLLRIEVEIDWGEALTQRMVDGLLVAQRNPQDAQGLYAQHNAESTRVFGNPHGRPDQVDLEDPQRAHLVYHVLVNGMVEESLLLTVSDVGEQMAWNGFLALRDSSLIFEKGTNDWLSNLKQGRLWTPDPRINRAVQTGRIAALRHIQRLRTGLASTDRLVERTPALVNASDAFDVVQSRNLLAHLRRVADKSAGILPDRLPLHAKDAVTPPVRLIDTNGAYVSAFIRHFGHHPNTKLLEQHYGALVGAIEQLIQNFVQLRNDDEAALMAELLLAAGNLAEQRGDSVNAARWQSEAVRFSEHADITASQSSAQQLPPLWEVRDNEEEVQVEPWAAIEFAGRAVWEGCGIQWTEQRLHLTPRWPATWPWWALIDLPYGEDGRISIVWDGFVLHTTQAIVTPLPVAQHDHIRLLHADEYNFNLTFQFVNEPNEEAYFRPEFLTA